VPAPPTPETPPTARADDARARRFRRARIALFAVVFVCLAQIGWWIYFQVRESGADRAAAVELGATPEVADATRRSRVRMAVGEGAFLAAALIGGVVLIWWLMERELRREHEQNQLLGAFGHDFRSPLTAIRLAAQTIDLDRATPAERARTVQSLLQNARRLEELVENVLAAARLHAGRLPVAPRPLDLAGEAERALADREALFARRGATIVRRFAPGLVVAADPVLLQSALGNLLDNALKYGGEAPHVTVAVERDGARARLSVTDRGAGFEPSRGTELFERFQRGDAESDRSRPGLGLGLWLVREIVALHGGAVAAHSAGPGAGATFAVALPLAEAGR
jgi:signal transduction histidine kinase